jgi:riboflavin kinase/FMN adenylyltransferase
LKIYHSVEEFQKVRRAVVTVGTFDGVHAGHRKIIGRVKEIAETDHGQVVVLSFFPHPRMVLGPADQPVKMLSTPHEKCILMGDFGVDHMIIHPFSMEFSKMPPDQFIKDILIENLGVYKLVTGYDHRFGAGRSGSFDNLVELASGYGFEVEQIPQKDIDDAAVSSTRIRKLLTDGEIEKANELLCSDYMISGKVVKGDQIGRKLGFPTANLDVPDYKLLPAEGVYICSAVHEGRSYNGLLSIGKRPTVTQSQEVTTEVYLQEFEKDIYGSHLQVNVKHRIRGNVKFESVDVLKSQMQKDLEYALKWNERNDR